MMKRLIASAAVTFVVFLPTLAAATETHKSTPHFIGTISAWDDTTKHATVKNAAGKETSFAWNEKTALTGTPKVGDLVMVSYIKDNDGQIWATHVSVGVKPTKVPAKK